MNIHIIRGLLIDCTSLVKSLFTAETFSFEECMALKRKYDIAAELLTSIVYQQYMPTEIQPRYKTSIFALC